MWKDVIGNYEINEYGVMRNKKTNRILKPKILRNGYVQYGISIEGKYRDISAHRTVAELFLENPNKELQVNHIDGNKQNNHFSNLEWVNRSDNMRHAVENKLLTNEHSTKKVAKLDKQGNILKIYDSLTLASIDVNGVRGHITNCCKGKRKTHKGFMWKYI